MKVRPATKPDVLTVLGCVRRIKNEYFEAKNINQWGEGYPSREIFAADVDRKALYVMYMGEVLIGFGAFIAGNEPLVEKRKRELMEELGSKFTEASRLGMDIHAIEALLQRSFTDSTAKTDKKNKTETPDSGKEVQHD